MAKIVQFARRVYFSCGHRYYNPKFSEEKNQKVFGACYSPHGHGHNYILEAWFQGPIDPDTGMIINLVDADAILKMVVAPLDHHFLNEDVEEFKSQVPTTENIALYCFDKIQQALNSQSCDLARVRLYENEDIWVDVENGK